MTPEKEGELFAKIDMLLSMLGGVTQRVGKVETEIAEMRGETKGRLEEQSRLLNTLVPQRIAAIPAR